MKYTATVFIEKDRETVVKLIQDPELFKEWMDGLTGYEIKHKTEDQVGTITELRFQDRKGRPSTMTEEVLVVEFPDKVVTTYEAGGVYNRCISKFWEEDEGTVYQMETIFKFGFLTSLFIWLFKGAFRKQTLSGMMSFKNFVERWEE